MAERKKDIHVDLLAIDMETGQHWLHPSQKHADGLEKIRKRNRDKWLKEQQAEANKAKTKAYEARARRRKPRPKTEIELWPEQGEDREAFMGRCIDDLTKCIGASRAEDVCASKWGASKELGKKGLVTASLGGDLAIEPCGKSCIACEGADAPFDARGFNPDEPRDESGKWTSGGGGAPKLPSGGIDLPPYAGQRKNDVHPDDGKKIYDNRVDPNFLAGAKKLKDVTELTSGLSRTTSRSGNVYYNRYWGRRVGEQLIAIYTDSAGRIKSPDWFTLKYKDPFEETVKLDRAKKSAGG